MTFSVDGKTTLVGSKRRTTEVETSATCGSAGARGRHHAKADVVESRWRGMSSRERLAHTSETRQTMHNPLTYCAARGDCIVSFQTGTDDNGAEEWSAQAKLVEPNCITTSI